MPSGWLVWFCGGSVAREQRRTVVQEAVTAPRGCGDSAEGQACTRPDSLCLPSTITPREL